MAPGLLNYLFQNSLRLEADTKRDMPTTRTNLRAMEKKSHVPEIAKQHKFIRLQGPDESMDYAFVPGRPPNRRPRLSGYPKGDNMNSLGIDLGGQALAMSG